MAIIIKPHVGFEKENCSIEIEGRYVLVVGKIDSNDISFLNVYHTPDTGPELMSQLVVLIITKSKGLMIFHADLNLILNPKLDSSSAKAHRGEKKC